MENARQRPTGPHVQLVAPVAPAVAAIADGAARSDEPDQQRADDRDPDMPPSHPQVPLHGLRRAHASRMKA
jgi:hypothetical protein